MHATPTRSRVALRGVRLCGALVVALFVAVGCDDRSGTRSADPLGIWAAASLTDVLPRVARAWEHDGGRHAVFSFEGSSRIARQLQAGAPADVFVSADERWMRFAIEHELVDARTRVLIARNRLVVALPRRPDHAPHRPASTSRTSTLDTPADLANASLERIALADSSVPAGRYAESALRALDLWDALAPRIVRGGDVRSILAWVARAQVDAGIVYASDASAEPRARTGLRLPATSHPPIVYPAGVSATAPHPRAARGFLEFCRGAKARAIFESAGFVPARGRLPGAGPAGMKPVNATP